MRSREDIAKLATGNITSKDVLHLEVLLDIRDLLIEMNVRDDDALYLKLEADNNLLSALNR
jgi:hypothetical protein